MKTNPIIIFFDDVVREYFQCYEQKGEKIMIEHLQKYLSDFSQNSEIIILTNQEVPKITNWFSKNNLLKFITKITNQSY